MCRRLCLPVTGLLLVFMLPARGQTPESITYNVAGLVTMPNRSPAPQAVVTLANDSGYVREVSADKDGRFEINGVQRGLYYLTAVNPADAEQYSDRVLVDVSRIFSNRLFFTLPLRLNPVRVSARLPRAAVTVAEHSQQIPKPARKEFERALKFRARRQFEEAIRSFDSAIQLYPEYVQAFAERGFTRIEMTRVADAEVDFSRALGLDPRYEPALRGAGICRFQNREYDSAVEYFEKSLEQDPRNVASCLFLGIAHSLLERPEHARPALKKALMLDARRAARAHVHLAYILLNENRPQEALIELETYFELAPNAPDLDELRQLRDQVRAGVEPR